MALLTFGETAIGLLMSALIAVQSIADVYSKNKRIRVQQRGVRVNTSLPLAVLIGCCIGGAVYQYLLSDWFFVTGITAIYVGITYFVTVYDIALLGEQFTFTDRYDRLGHAVGLFGVATSPLALVEYVDFQSSEVAGVLIWTTGIIAYFTVVSAAQSHQR